MAKNNVELIDDSNQYCSEIAALDVEVSNRGKRTINYLDWYWDNVFGTSTTEQSYGTLNTSCQTIFRKLRKTN